MIHLVNDQILRYHDRDIVLVRQGTPENPLPSQPMYRSTGRNSGMPGVWFPFDGILFNGTWFNKSAYCHPVVSPDFHRFGNQELKDLGIDLGNMDIPEGIETSWEEINNFLGV